MVEGKLSLQNAAQRGAGVCRNRELGTALAGGGLGGVLGSLLLATSLIQGLLLGGLFGLVFGLLFARRASSGGAGLIWGISCALLLWIVFPAGLMPLFTHAGHSMAGISAAGSRFSGLVAHCLF